MQKEILSKFLGNTNFHRGGFRISSAYLNFQNFPKNISKVNFLIFTSLQKCSTNISKLIVWYFPALLWKLKFPRNYSEFSVKLCESDLWSQKFYRMVFVACLITDEKSSYESSKVVRGSYNKPFFWKCGLTPPRKFSFGLKPPLKSF